MMQGGEGQVLMFGRGSMSHFKQKEEAIRCASGKKTIGIHEHFSLHRTCALCLPNTILFILGHSLE